MTEAQEIQKRIEREQRRVKRLAETIQDAKADIRATRKAIKFWEEELRKAKKRRM